MRHYRDAAIYVDTSTVEQWQMGDWSNPRLVRTAEADSTIHDCICDDRYVYAADGIRGLKAYEIGQPQSIQWKPFINWFLLEPVDILPYGDYAFYICENRWSIGSALIKPHGEINILKIADLEAPVLVKTLPEKIMTNIADAKVWQDHLYILKDGHYEEEGELSIYQINPANPTDLKHLGYQKVVNDMCLAFHKDIMMVTGLFTDVDFYDISTPEKIVYLSTYELPVYCPCYWEGFMDTLGREYFYLPWGSDAAGGIHGFGLKVLDISDPRHPHEVRDVPFEFGWMEIAQEKDYLYSAHGHHITVINVHDPVRAFVANEYTDPKLYMSIAATAEKTLLLSGTYPVGYFNQPCIIRADISRPPAIGRLEVIDSHQTVLDLLVPKDEILYSVEWDNLGIYAFSLGM